MLDRSRPKKRGRRMGRPNKLSDQAQIARANRITDGMSATTRRSYALQFIDRYRDLAQELGLAVAVRSIEAPATTQPAESWAGEESTS